MVKFIQTDFLHATFSVGVPSKTQQTEDKNWKGRSVSPQAGKIRNYWALTVWLLERLPRVARLLGIDAKTDIWKCDYIVEKRGKDGTIKTESTYCYLNAKEAQQFKETRDPVLSQPEAEAGLTAEQFSLWLQGWAEKTQKVNAAATSVLGTTKTPEIQTLEKTLEPVLSSFNNTEEQIGQLTSYLKSEDLSRDQKMHFFLQKGNIPAIQWLQTQQVDGKAFDIHEMVQINVADFDGEVLPIRENALLIAMKRTDPEGRQVADFIHNQEPDAYLQQGRSFAIYSWAGYEKFGRPIQSRSVISVTSPSFKHDAKGLDKPGSIAASMSQLAQGMGLTLQKDPVVTLMGDKNQKPSLQIQFSEEDEAAAEEILVHFAAANLLALDDWDADHRQLIIPPDHAEEFLEHYCKLSPHLISSSYYKAGGEVARYEELHHILYQYAPDFKVIMSPYGSPQVQFTVPRKAVDKLKTTISQQIRGSMRTEWEAYRERMTVEKPDEKIMPWKEPLSENFQVKDVPPPGMGVFVTLSSNESYHLLGYGKEDESTNSMPSVSVQKKEKEFKDFMMRLAIEDVINNTPAIDKFYTTKTSIKDQRQAHETAKGILVNLIAKLGGIVSFFKPPSGLPVVELKDAQKLPEQGGKALKSSVFSWENIQDVQEDIQKDGQRKEDNIVVYGVASQFNSCESPERKTLPPGKATEIYVDDPTQGPRAQLQFGRLQVEVINAMGNRGLNALCHVLDEATKNAIQHGYLTPTSLDMLKNVIERFKTHGDQIQYTCVGNVPTEGTKPVHQLLTAAPAFGDYRLAYLPIKLEEELQFLCALHSFRAQFAKVIDLAKEENKPVVFKPAAVGLGVFKNNPEVVAKAFYMAAKEYEQDLADNDVKVKFQVYKGTGPGRRIADYLKLSQAAPAA